MTDEPIDHSGAPAEERLEMLCGHLFDALTTARRLASEMQLPKNASVATRGLLEQNAAIIGVMWEQLQGIEQYIQSDRSHRH